jgi:hypothetical protein
MDAYSLKFETVLKSIRQLEHEGKIVATRTKQDVKTKGGVIAFPVYAPALVKAELLESLTEYRPRYVDADTVLVDEILSMYGYPEAI